MERSFYILISLLIFLGMLVLVEAEEPLSEIVFPIPELGNCGSRSECEAYCDLAENMAACLDFADIHNLLTKEEIEMAKKMLALGETAGPGGCHGKTECEAYCDDINHIEECLVFAEKYGLIPAEELEEAKKVAAAIKQGIKPPNCGSKSQCDIYCSRPENMEECLVFAEAAGLIPPEELQEAKQVLAAIRKGAKPPPCQGKTECDIYCAQPEHLEGCITFAEAAGFISPEEAAMARKTGGKGPGGCRGEAECEAYCEDPSHAEECINFAVEYGFMSSEEAESAKKMMAAGLTSGPGGCKGQKECEAYCNDLAHMQECVDFAERAGFMSAEEAARARKMAEMGVVGGPGGCQGEEECRAFCENPANMSECLDFAVKIGEMTPEQAGQARQGEQAMQAGGPGGCQSQAECEAYCAGPEHAEECVRFSMEQGFISTEEGQKMLEMMQGPPEEMMEPPSGEMGPPPGEMEHPPEEMMAPPPEKMEPSPEEQMPPEEMMPPPEQVAPMPEETAPAPVEPEPSPQSLFEQAKQFLASVAIIFGF